MNRIALKFAYSAEGFFGYARQTGLRTVEGELTKALRDLHIIESIEGNRFRSGSRTDRGVWAAGNVCAFDTDFPLRGLCGALNRHIGANGIWAVAAASVDADFNPRHARRRTYRYFLNDDSKTLDIDAMRGAAGEFLGEHDFSNFARLESGRTPVRQVDEIHIGRAAGGFPSSGNEYATFDFSAPNFLWNQVRRMVGAIKLCGEGRLGADDIRRALSNPQERSDYGLADARGLVLMDVDYGTEVSFEAGRDAGKVGDTIRSVIKKREKELLLLGSMLCALRGKR